MYFNYYSPLTAITEDHSRGGLRNRILFLTALETGKSKIKVLADIVHGEGTPPGLQMISSCCTLTWQRRGDEGRWRERERERSHVCVFSYKCTDPLYEGSILITELPPKHFTC